MAKITLPINSISDPQNIVPVNGKYIFQVKFYITTSDTLSGNTNYTQNQNIELNSISTPFNLDITVGNGVYTITNITAKIFYNNKLIGSKNLDGVSINCLSDCQNGPFPIAVIKVSPGNYQITHQSTGITQLRWTIKKQGTTVDTNVINISSGSGSFIIATMELEPVEYVLELKAINCTGTNTLNFTPENIANPNPEGNFRANSIQI